MEMVLWYTFCFVLAGKHFWWNLNEKLPVIPEGLKSQPLLAHLPHPENQSINQSTKCSMEPYKSFNAFGRRSANQPVSRLVNQPFCRFASPWVSQSTCSFFCLSVYQPANQSTVLTTFCYANELQYRTKLTAPPVIPGTPRDPISPTTPSWEKETERSENIIANFRTAYSKPGFHRYYLLPLLVPRLFHQARSLPSHPMRRENKNKNKSKLKKKHSKNTFRTGCINYR